MNRRLYNASSQETTRWYEFIVLDTERCDTECKGHAIDTRQPTQLQGRLLYKGM